MITIILDSVFHIGNDAFKACTSLIKFEFPSSIRILNESVLNSHQSLTDIIIPNYIVAIMPNTFNGICTFNKCKSFKKVVFKHNSSLKTLCDFIT